MVRLPFLILLLMSSPVVFADSRQLLASAVDKWGQEVDRWTFVQHVREFRGAEVGEVRDERFDPSRPDTKRWELLSINNRRPTAEEVRAFDQRKNRKPRNRVSEPHRFIDFDHVKVTQECEDTVSFEVPLRGDLSFFIPFEKILARVEIDKRTSDVRRVDVGLLDELRIAFGFVRVTRLTMQFLQEPDSAPRPKTPGTAVYSGRSLQASATMIKFGRRSELTWSQFEPVPVSANR